MPLEGLLPMASGTISIADGRSPLARAEVVLDLEGLLHLLSLSGCLLWVFSGPGPGAGPQQMLAELSQSRGDEALWSFVHLKNRIWTEPRSLLSASVKSKDLCHGFPLAQSTFGFWSS